ncbi:MAG: hypothetical protein WBB28_28780 [Crinalium sp.]
MTNEQAYKNAVLDDKELQQALKSINPKFGDFVTRVAGEAWGLPLIDQKTKALNLELLSVRRKSSTARKWIYWFCTAKYSFSKRRNRVNRKSY